MAWSHQREESPPELAEDIERLVRLAYPDVAESMVEVLAKDQFMDSLPEEDMCLHIRQNRPATLRAAMETALELESFQLASNKAEVQLEEHPVQQQESAKPKESVNTDVLQQLVEALKHYSQKCRGPTPRTFKRGTTPGGKSTVVCWKCEHGERN